MSSERLGVQSAGFLEVSPGPSILKPGGDVAYDPGEADRALECEVSVALTTFEAGAKGFYVLVRRERSEHDRPEGRRELVKVALAGLLAGATKYMERYVV